MTKKELNKIKKRITTGCKRVVVKLENEEAERYELFDNPSGFFEKFVFHTRAGIPVYQTKIIGKKYTRYILDYIPK
ncbi:MAG TPA: hypothetical protein V6C58_11795 [Allocoleopsis sp.]